MRKGRQKTMRALKTFVLALPMVLLAQSAHAATYQIQLSGINIVYDQAAGTICDTGGGIGCNGTADPLISANYIVDNNPVATDSSNLAFNFLAYVAPGTNPLANGSTNLLNVSNDVFDFQISGVPGLFTDITSGSVTFSNNSINLGGTGFSTIFGQNLPHGFVATNPINWSFSSGALGGTSSCTGTAGSLICTYSGTGELSWFTAPEPALMALFGMGLFGIGAARRRRS